MTPQQLALLQKLAISELSFNDLAHSEKLLLTQTLRPVGSFSSEQRGLLKNWYLVLDTNSLNIIQTKLANYNSTAKIKLGLATRETKPITFEQGTGWFDSGTSSNRRQTVTSGSLLTDCRPGDTWGVIGEDLINLVIAKIPAELFPEVKAEDL